MTDLEKAARMALEALEGVATWVEVHPKTHPWDTWQRVEPAITALRRALEQPASKDWRLMPRTATPEMLKAMDECSKEGYDERLYAGHASSVYMAAWDAAPEPEQPAQGESK